MKQFIFLLLFSISVSHASDLESCVHFWNVNLAGSDIVTDEDDNLYIYGEISEPEYSQNVIWGPDTFLYEEDTYMIAKLNSDETFGWFKTFQLKGSGSSIRYGDGTIYMFMNSDEGFIFDGVTLKNEYSLSSVIIIGLNASDGSLKFSNNLSKLNQNLSRIAIRKTIVTKNGDLIVPIDFDIGFKTNEDSVVLNKDSDTTNATAVLKFNSSGIHEKTWIGYYDYCIADVYDNSVVVLGCKSPPLKERIYEMTVLDNELNTVSEIPIPITISGFISSFAYSGIYKTTFRADANSVYMVSNYELDKEYLDVKYSTTIFGQDMKEQEDKYAFLSWDYSGNLKWMKFLDNVGSSPEIDLNNEYLQLFGELRDGKIIQDSIIIPNFERSGVEVVRYDTASGNILNIFPVHSGSAFLNDFAQLSDGGYILKSTERNRYLEKFLDAAPDKGDLFLYNYKPIVYLSKFTKDFEVSPIFYWCDDPITTIEENNLIHEPFRLNLTQNTLDICIMENKECQLIIYDRVGRQISNTTISNEHLSIDISHLSNDLYFVSLLKGKKKYTKKILIP